MNKIEQWLSEYIAKYEDNPKNTLEAMLSETNDVIEQYLNSQTNATKGLLESCMKCNKLFLQSIEDLAWETKFLQKYIKSTLFGVQIKSLSVRKDEDVVIVQAIDGKSKTFYVDEFVVEYDADGILCSIQSDPDINVSKY